MPEKILIVDDDVDTLRLVGLMLQRQGYQIVAASNGHQALILAQSEKPDLVLLDIMMPEVDGYEVARQLRADPVTSSTPIIMFTAKSQVDDKVMGFEAGADDYLTKPTQPRELFAHVRAVLTRGAKTRPLPAETVSKERGHVLGVLSAKGGVGVSTLALNLAITLRQRTNKEVILAEFRPGYGSIALDLGYLHPEGLNRLLQRKATDITANDVEAELSVHKTDIRLLLASYRARDARLQNAAENFEIITRHLAHLGNYIIIDLGAGLPPFSDRVLSHCDELILVLEPHPHTIDRSQELGDELVAKGFGEGRLNTVLYNRQRSELQLTLAQVQQQFKHPITVVFTAAPELALQASKNNVPLVVQHPDTLTAQQFAKLADNLTKRLRTK